MSFIKVDNLCKEYKIKKRKEHFWQVTHKERVKALNGVSFDVEKGDIIGYIGPNGSGKSTTIKLLAGILRPDSGTGEVNGCIPWETRKSYVRNIGVMFGQRSQLLWDLPARDSFIMLKDIYRLKEEEFEKTFALLIEMLDISELMRKPIRQMSLGQRMKCEFAATFIHNPELVFLDEPTIGMDVEVKDTFRKFILEVNKRLGTTIFITSHDLGDIQAVCNKLLIINKGEVHYKGTVQGLFERNYVKQRIFIEMEKAVEIILPKEVKILHYDRNKYLVEVIENRNVGEIINNIAKNNNIINIYAEKIGLEDIILEIYKDLKTQNDNEVN